MYTPVSRQFSPCLGCARYVFNILLAALRWHGYRSENRYLVFQVLEHTLGIAPEVWRVLAQCHQKRNLAEYEGHLEINDQLLVDLIKACALLLEKVSALGIIAR